MKKSEISQLEVDILMIYYTFSDEYGVVDVPKAKAWAKQRLGVILADDPFVITQEHVDFLVEHKVLPDVMSLLEKFRAPRRPDLNTE